MSKVSDGFRSLTGGRGITQYSMVIALIAIIVIFECLEPGYTLDPTNVINVVQQYSYIFILAIGMVMVIIAGHIDLSVGSVSAFVGISVAQSMAVWHFPPGIAMLFGLVIGVAVGAWQGFWVAYVRVPAFIVTLAGQLIFRGGNQLIGGGTDVPTPTSYNWIGGGFIPDFGGGNFSNGTLLLGLLVILALIFTELRNRRRRIAMNAKLSPVWATLVKLIVLCGITVYATLEFASGDPGTSFPVVGIIAGVLILIYSFVMNNTIFGRQIYAVGGNSAAAVLSGVNSRRVNFFVMLNMSVLAAIAGMVYVGHAQASGLSDGTGWELDAIAAVFVGGAAVSGGIGTVNGSIIGAFVMAFLTNGLSGLGIDSDYTSIIRGLVLLLAVAFDVYNKTQGRPSLTGQLLRVFRRPPKDGAPPVTEAGLEAQPQSITSSDSTTSNINP
jgi:putative multiple sugar transport system permease protein